MSLPSMLARLEQQLIYSYKPADQRRDLRARHSFGPFSSILDPLPAEWREEPLESRLGPAQCWVGACPGCGRTLVSATTSTDAAADRFWCSRRCREAR